MALYTEMLRHVAQRLPSQVPQRVVAQALQRCAPPVRLRPIRVAGTTYPVPAVISLSRGVSVAAGWLVEGARRQQRRRGGPLALHLATLVVETVQGQGYACAQYTETLRLAQANRAYLRYRWW
jgi:small subunit ribosomal protein S7